MKKSIAIFLMIASMALAAPTAPLNYVLEWLDGLPKPEKWNFNDGWTYRFAQNIGKDDPLKIRLIDSVDYKKSQNYTYDRKNKLLLPYSGDIAYGDLYVAVSGDSGVWRVNLSKHSFRFYAYLKEQDEKFSIIQTNIEIID
jgi:outer membrane protein assembly factor BamA